MGRKRKPRAEHSTRASLYVYNNVAICQKNQNRLKLNPWFARTMIPLRFISDIVEPVGTIETRKNRDFSLAVPVIRIRIHL